MTAVLRAAEALAQPRSSCAPAEVDRQVNASVDLRRRNLDLAGFEILRDLWQRCPSPRVRAQLALAEQGLGRWRDAYIHLREALDAPPDAWTTSRRSALLGALGIIRGHLPQLDPLSNVLRAELRVNGERVGTLPLREPLVVADGHATVEVSAPGYRTLRRELTLREGEVFRESLTLTREAVVATQPPPPVPVSPVRPPPLTQPTSAQRAVGWTVLGAGVLLGGLGVWQWLAWRAQGDDTRGATPQSPGDLGAWARYELAANPAGDLAAASVCDRARGDVTADAAGARNLCDENARHAAMALGFGIGGAVLAVTGIVLVSTAPSRRERTAWRVGPWMAGGVRGASLRVEF